MKHIYLQMKSAPYVRWMNSYKISHLSGVFILFTFEQNNSCLTKFCIQKVTSKIFPHEFI